MACLLAWAGPSTGQIMVPDRLANGERMPVFLTPADWGSLPFDTIRGLPTSAGGRDTWWHRHGLFMDGSIQLALDPVLDLSLDRKRTWSEGETPTWKEGHRNVRGVRYTGQIDNRIRFGGKVLEMQRLLVSPETHHVLSAQEYPGMGPGKLRPNQNGLYSLDHSLSEVWFDAQVSNRIRMQWGLGATGMGPGVRNLLWSDARAPSPFLLVELDLGKGWCYRWVQSRQRGRMRLPANGAREGRYAPLGLSIRSLGKSFHGPKHKLDIHFIIARWTDVSERGQHRGAAIDWVLAMSPWLWPHGQKNTVPWYMAGHQGLDVQWRGKSSTWYGQMRLNPNFDRRYSEPENDLDLQPVQAMLGHVRHGDQWSVWSEWAPTAASTPEAYNPMLPVSPLGIQPWSPLRNSWVQGVEWRLFGITISAEAGRTIDKNTSLKTSLRIPSAAADASSGTLRSRRRTAFPNRLWPALVPLSPFVSVMGITGTRELWWAFGLSSPVVRTRKTH